MNRGGVLNCAGVRQTNGILTLSAGNPIQTTTTNNYMNFGAGGKDWTVWGEAPNSAGPRSRAWAA
jgi:hypothetical protein